MPDTIDIEVVDHDGSFLRSFEERVDAWLEDLVDDTVDHAAGRLRHHAPGAIDALVTSDGPQFEPEGGVIEGMAGVLPDPDETFVSARGSKRSDHPFYVDVGTGVFGETGRPITAMPGSVMGPIEWGGRMIYVKSIKGQRAQDYSGAAFRDTDAWLPFKIQESKSKLVGT